MGLSWTDGGRFEDLDPGRGRSIAGAERDREDRKVPPGCLKPGPEACTAVGGLAHRDRLAAAVRRAPARTGRAADSASSRPGRSGGRGRRTRPATTRARPLEGVLVLAEQHVGVDQRAPAQAARDERADPRERPDVVEPVLASLGVPERARTSRGVRGKLPGGQAWPRSSTQTSVRRPLAAGRPPVAESRTDDDGVEVVQPHPRGFDGLLNLLEDVTQRRAGDYFFFGA